MNDNYNVIMDLGRTCKSFGVTCMSHICPFSSSFLQQYVRFLKSNKVINSISTYFD